jgi:AbrB family looped-hinge helix DNA binding protein
MHIITDLLKDILGIRQIKMTSKNQITVPKEFTDKLNLDDGSKFKACLLKDAIILIPLKEDE